MRPRSAGRHAPGFVDQDLEKLRSKFSARQPVRSLSTESLPMYSQVTRSASRLLAYELRVNVYQV